MAARKPGGRDRSPVRRERDDAAAAAAAPDDVDERLRRASSAAEAWREHAIRADQLRARRRAGIIRPHTDRLPTAAELRRPIPRDVPPRADLEGGPEDLLVHGGDEYWERRGRPVAPRMREGRSGPPRTHLTAFAPVMTDYERERAEEMDEGGMPLDAMVLPPGTRRDLLTAGPTTDPRWLNSYYAWVDRYEDRMLRLDHANRDNLDWTPRAPDADRLEEMRAVTTAARDADLIQREERGIPDGAPEQWPTAERLGVAVHDWRPRWQQWRDEEAQRRHARRHWNPDRVEAPPPGYYTAWLGK